MVGPPVREDLEAPGDAVRGPAVLLAPVDRPEEVGPLADAGAHELYGGVLPRDWPGGAALSANQRTFAAAQFPSEDAFAAAARAASARGVPLYLALNAPLYAPEAYPSLLGLARRAAGWGVAGIIAGDPGLLGRLAREELPLAVVLSTLAGALNARAVGFFRTLGATRVVLPRHLTLAEIGAVVRAHPDLPFEAFVLIGRCPFEEAYCTFHHGSPAQRWPCEIPYRLADAAGEVPRPGHPAAAWHRSWAAADRRHACGVCGLPELLALGVRHFKLVGRGGPTEAKVANLRLVAAFAGGDRSRAEAREAYERRFGRPCHPLTCYVPELHPRSGGG